MKSILDRTFVYRDAAHTNIKLRFDRERKRIKDEAARKLAEVEAVKLEAILKVRGIR